MKFHILCRVVSIFAILFLTSCDRGKSKPVNEVEVTVRSVEPLPGQIAGKNLGPVFEDVTAQTGIQFQYQNGESAPHLAILESLGGGLGVIDFDGDGLQDLILIGGGYYGGEDGKKILGHPCKLFRNCGNWKFEDVSVKAGFDKLSSGRPWFFTHGVAVADYDQDGWPDILITGWREVLLLHNEPDGQGGRRFVDTTKAAGLDTGITWATSAAWADLDSDGKPELFIGQYVDWSFNNHPSCNYDGKTPDVCPPKRFKGIPSKVYHNLGGGRFQDVSQEAGIMPADENSSKTLGVLAVDLNLDGKPEVYVANDTVPNFLYVNKSTVGKIRFVEQGLTTGVAMDGGGKPNGSMGVDVGDPECLGKPSLWITNYENEFHAYYRNMSTPERCAFVFATESSGAGSIGQKFVGWGTAFLDYDRDGWEDLFVANGHAIRFPTGTTRRQRPVLFQNSNRKFKDYSRQAGEYFQQQHLSRGIVSVDLDNDGQVDLVVCNTNEPVAVLKNVVNNSNHWLGISLVGKNFADVVGARVQVELPSHTQTRFAKGGSSYMSSSDRRMVFGLGDQNQIAKLTVTWPDRTVQSWTNVNVDRYLKIQQGSNDLK
jgi:enediyne biosynthesis protein E4